MVGTDVAALGGRYARRAAEGHVRFASVYIGLPQRGRDRDHVSRSNDRIQFGVQELPRAESIRQIEESCREHP